MTDDAELLRQYAHSGSETAFAELVSRHLPLVYSAALRQVRGDEALAKDVAQTVFIDLARKASSLLGRELLAGWLYTSARLAASKAVRGNQRRHLREQIAVSMEERTTPPESQPDHGELKLVLDQAMSELGSDERNAVLIRFFQGKDLKDVGLALGISEDAARMRIARALAKLQTLLKQRGVTITTVALGTALATEAVAAVPAGLAASISTAAVASAAAGVGITATLVKLMTMTKVKFAIISVIAVAGVAIPLAIQNQSQARLREENQALRQQVEQLRGTEEQLAKAKVDQDELERLRRGQSELLRLRGEVTALRKASKATALQPLPAERVNVDASAVPDSVSPVTRLQAIIRTRVGSGDTLVTGGWISGPGKRIFVLATPSILGENADQVNINTKVVEVPEAVLPEVGFDTFRTEGAESSLQQVIAAAQVAILLKRLQATDGADLIAQSGISVSDGHQGQVRTSNEQTIDGAKVDLGPVIDIIPVISGDKKAIDLTLQVGINRLTSKAQ